MKIDHIVVYTTNMDKSVEFYTKSLGLPLRSHSPYWSEVGGEENGVYIGLHPAKSFDIVSKHMDISFRVDNIEQAREELEAKGVEFYDEITQISPTSWFTSFKDPDGNHLSLYASV